MDELIKADLYRYAGQTDFFAFLRSLRIPGFRFTYFLRKASKHSKYTLPGIVYRLFYHRYTYKYGYQIAHHAKIGKGFQISHFGCLVINSKAIIGDNCYVSHNVTIGQTNRGPMKGFPVIGNKVWIGPGAVLVGNITIGDNVLIAPNAYVNVSVPSNSVALGNPAKIIANELATADYIVNTV